MAKLTMGVLRAGSGKTLCYVDLDIDGILTILGASLYQDNAGEIQLGMPLRQTSDGKWAPTVRLSDAAYKSVRKRLHEAFLASDLSKPGTQPSAGTFVDPFDDGQGD